MPLTRLDSARLRHARHYERVLRRADAAYLGGGAAADAALRQFDAEWPNIALGQSAAASLRAIDTDAARCCSDYGNAGAAIFAFRLHPRKLIEWFDVAHAASCSLSDRASRAAHLHNLGFARFALGETQSALDAYEASLELHQASGNQAGEADARAGAAEAWLRLGRVDDAQREHEQRLITVRRLGDVRAQAKALGSLASLRYLRGDFRGAVEYH